MKSHARTIYTALDFLGDVGGFSDAMSYIGGTLLWMLQGERLMKYLVSHMFKLESKTRSNEDGSQLIEETKDVIR